VVAPRRLRMKWIASTKLRGLSIKLVRVPAHPEKLPATRFPATQT
jgi:hypothetical protein